MSAMKSVFSWLVAPSLGKMRQGVGGPVGKKRMRWMIDVCNAWDMEDLALLDNEMMKKLLDEGWEKDRVPRLSDVAPDVERPAPVTQPFSMLVPSVIGFFAGVAGTAIVMQRLMSKT